MTAMTSQGLTSQGLTSQGLTSQGPTSQGLGEVRLTARHPPVNLRHSRTLDFGRNRGDDCDMN